MKVLCNGPGTCVLICLAALVPRVLILRLSSLMTVLWSQIHTNHICRIVRESNCIVIIWTNSISHCRSLLCTVAGVSFTIPQSRIFRNTSLRKGLSHLWPCRKEKKFQYTTASFHGV